MNDFIYKRGVVASNMLLNTLADIITATTEFPAHGSDTPIKNAWKIVDSVKDAGNVITKLTLSVDRKADGKTKTFYYVIDNVAQTTPAKHSTWSVSQCDGFKEADKSFELVGPPVRYEWADHSVSASERTNKRPVYYELNLNNNRIVAVFHSDPVVDVTDSRKSLIYIGGIVPYKYNNSGEMIDFEGNSLLTAGAVTAEPAVPAKGTAGYFGVHTSMGNTSLQMLRTKSTVEFQEHFPSIFTQAQSPTIELANEGFQASKWTDRYHLSPIHVFHTYEGMRGVLDGVVAVTKHNVRHGETFILDVEGKDYKQEVYTYFSIDTAENLFKKSANPKTGVAILREYRY